MLFHRHSPSDRRWGVILRPSMDPRRSPYSSTRTLLSRALPQWDRQFRLVRVHHEDREELCRLRLAGISADAVAVAGQFGEALPGPVSLHRPVVDLTADLPLKHRCVDEGRFDEGYLGIL